MINDYMFGDWLQSKKGIQYVNIKDCFDMLTYGNNDNFEPIEITPEILLNNGFTEGEFGRFICDDIIICFTNDNKVDSAVIEHSSSYVDIEIKYVHELQHLLKLIGIDKEFEL